MGQPVRQLTYTPQQAAHVLGLTESAIRARIFRGQLPVQRWGRRLLIRREDVEQILGRAITEGK
jgi:excisionase family DNA binding protein